LLRQYAEEQLTLSDEEEQAAHETHARYFAGFMLMHQTMLHDHRQRVALHEIEADFDNIRAAWDYWTERQDAARLLDFTSAAWLFFEARGSFAPAIQFFGSAAQKLRANVPEVIGARAELQARQAWFTALIGQPEDGLGLSLASVQTLRRYAPDAVSVEILEDVTINAIFLNRDETLVQITQDMMARADRSGDGWERAWALIWGAFALVVQGQASQALQAGQEARAIFESRGNQFGISVASGIILGSIFMTMGDFGTAKTHLLRGVEAAEEINYLRMLQICNDSLGTLALIEGDVQGAEQFFLSSLRISQKCGQTREILASLRDIARVRIAEGDLDGALQLAAVVLKHPVSEQNSLNRPERLRDETEKLRTQVEGRLEPAQYRAAWEAGQRRRLPEVVAQILS
jgi:hypothetical protein